MNKLLINSSTSNNYAFSISRLLFGANEKIGNNNVNPTIEIGICQCNNSRTSIGKKITNYYGFTDIHLNTGVGSYQGCQRSHKYGAFCNNALRSEKIVYCYFFLNKIHILRVSYQDSIVGNCRNSSHKKTTRISVHRTEQLLNVHTRLFGNNNISILLY